MLSNTSSPTRRYIAICCDTNFTNHYLRGFSLPEFVKTNDSRAAAHYFLIRLNNEACIEGCISMEAYEEMKIAPNSILKATYEKKIKVPQMKCEIMILEDDPSKYIIDFVAPEKAAEDFARFGRVAGLNRKDCYRLYYDPRYDGAEIMNYMEQFKPEKKETARMRFWYYNIGCEMVASAYTAEEAAKWMNTELHIRGIKLPEPILPEDLDEVDSLKQQVELLRYDADDFEDD